MDLKHFRGEMDLVKDIKKFGGKVESFLSKDVNYVVTDRPEAKPKIEPSCPDTPNLFAPLMSPTDLYKSPYGFMLSPAPSSPFNERGKGTVTSRGLALVQKAKQKSGGTGDVLGICQQWKIKVFHVQVIVLFINKLKNSFGKKEQECKETRVIAEVSQSPQCKLSIPYIKIEDAKRRYRIRYKELRPADAVFKSDLSRAFRKVCEDFHRGDLNTEKCNSSVLKEINSPSRDQHSPITVSFTPVIHKNFSTPSVFKKQFGSKMGLLNDSKENHVNGAKKYHANESKENIKKAPSPKRKKDRKGSSDSTRREKNHAKQKYCEICQEQYVDLEAHILSAKHNNYVGDTVYFMHLHEVISTLPGVDSFLQKIARQRQEKMLQQSEFKSDKSHVEYQFEEYENHHNITPHSGRIPPLNCEEDFSDSTKGIQPEPIRTENGQDNGVYDCFHCPDPFNAGVVLEDKENPDIQPKSPARCDDVYNAATEDYVSASCSTDDSNMLAYLEDSIDNLVSCKKDHSTQHASPSILLKESPIIEPNQPLPLITFHSPYGDASGDALDLTNRTKGLDHGDHVSSAALDLSLPPPVLSPVFSYVSSAKRRPYSFSKSKAKRLKFDTDASLEKCEGGSGHLSQDEISQNCNSSFLSQLPKNGIVSGEVANGDPRFESGNYKHSINKDENSLDCAFLLSPIDSVQRCPEMRMLDGDEEATQMEEHHISNEMDPNQNVADGMKKAQECVNSVYPFAVCTAEPLVQEHVHQTKELGAVTPSLNHSFVVCKSPTKDVPTAAESCNAGSVINSVKESDQNSEKCKENSVVMAKCDIEPSLPIHGLNDEVDNTVDVDMPFLQCCICDNNDQLESLTADIPVLESHATSIAHTSAVFDLELNVFHNTNVMPNLEDLQSQGAVQGQNSCYGSFAVQDSPHSSDKAMVLGCLGEPECVSLKNMDSGSDVHQNEPAFQSVKENSVPKNSASVSVCPDPQADVYYISNHFENTSIFSCKEIGKESQTFLLRGSSESFGSQKDMNDCKCMSFEWKADFKASDFPTLNNVALNCSVNPSSGGVESAIASENADASKWVSECDISSGSEPEWENLKSNVDSLCQELEKLNSEPDIVTELPLNLALI